MTALIVSACGGGGGNGNPTLISGTAAAGAPIIGTVTIKDSSSPAKTKTVTIEANGKYTIDVTDLTAPFMVRADGYVGGNEYHLYSAGTSADAGGTINITPLTDLIVANIAGSVAQTYFNSGDFSNLTATQLNTEAEALKEKLLPVLQALGVSDSIDLLRASFSTDHTGLDAALDVLKVETDANTNVATITNIITQQQITSNIATGNYSGVLTDTTNVASGVTDIQEITAGFKQLSDLFSTSLPSETNPNLLALFDPATFLHEGEDLDAFLSDITTDGEMIGISFINISIQSIDAAQGTAVVTFDVLQNGRIEQDAPEYWHMIKKAGKWYMQGTQRIAEVDIESRAEYMPAISTIRTGLEIDISDRGGRGITSAVITGNGIADSATVTNNIEYEWFSFPGNGGDSTYVMNDTQIDSIADVGEVYTVKLYSGTTLLATYTEKLFKRPYLNAELTSAKFPSISAPTVSQLRAFNGGSTTVSWTLPSGYTGDWLDLGLGDSAGNTARAQYSLSTAATSKFITLSAITSTGQAFTPTSRWIWLSTRDSYGRRVATSFW